MGDDYVLDLQKNWDLANPEEKYDVIPEVWNGKNIADYIDPDIMTKLEALEKEEELREKSGYYESEVRHGPFSTTGYQSIKNLLKCGCFSLQESESETEDMKEIREMASKIRVKKKIMKVDSRIDGGVKRQPLPRTSTAAKRSRSVARLKGEFTELGVDMTGTEDVNFTKTRGRSTSKAG